MEVNQTESQLHLQDTLHVDSMSAWERHQIRSRSKQMWTVSPLTGHSEKHPHHFTALRQLITLILQVLDVLPALT